VKNLLLVMLVVVTILVGGGPWAIREAHSVGPVIQVVEINGHRTRFDNADAASVRYLLIDPSNADPTTDGFTPIDPVAVLTLFIGGDGTLNLMPTQQNTGSTNFLARTRYHFAAEGYVVALVDAASDFVDHNHNDTRDANGFLHGSGLRGHRLPNRLHGDKYLQDLAAVMNDLRDRYPNLPLWAVGTSQGTISAAVAAANLSPPPDGIVLTSSLTGPSALGDLQSVDLEVINVPALIVTNQDDACSITKPEDSKALKLRFTASPRVQVRNFDGGSTPLSNPCESLSGHGFFGIEQKVIEAVTKWIKRIEQ
jgi:dienelactone hydrolase